MAWESACVESDWGGGSHFLKGETRGCASIVVVPHYLVSLGTFYWSEGEETLADSLDQ